MPLLELRRVVKAYGSGEQVFVALWTTSLTLEAGEIVVVVGPSGSGKTTLLSIMGCTLRPTAGQVLVQDVDAAKLGEGDLPALRARCFGFIFQQYHLFAALTALENVEMALVMKFGRYPQARDEAARLLTTVGLGPRMRYKPATLSGGERQRVAIARALSGGPPLLLCDEPTAALDSTNAMATVELLQKLAHEEMRGVVIVTHDHRLEQFADRVMTMEDGWITSVTCRDDAVRAAGGQIPRPPTESHGD